MKPSLDEQIKCVRRELKLRVSFYPRLVKSGKLREGEANREIAAMQAVLETLESLVRRASLLERSLNDRQFRFEDDV